MIGETEQDVREKLAWIGEHYARLVPADHARREQAQLADGYLVGTPEQLVERLRAVEQIGMAYAIAYFLDAAYDPSSMELFASKVIPELT